MFCFIKKLFGLQPSLPCADIKSAEKAARYAVYIYYPESNKSSGAQWRKVGATRNGKRAMKQAQLLHKKQQYQKVEVKKCSYFENKSLNYCKTIRVYNKKEPSPIEKYMRGLSVSS